MKPVKWAFCLWVVVSFMPPHGRFDEPLRYIASVGVLVIGLAEIRDAILKTKQA